MATKTATAPKKTEDAQDLERVQRAMGQLERELEGVNEATRPNAPEDASFEFRAGFYKTQAYALHIALARTRDELRRALGLSPLPLPED